MNKYNEMNIYELYNRFENNKYICVKDATSVLFEISKAISWADCKIENFHEELDVHRDCWDMKYASKYLDRCWKELGVLKKMYCNILDKICL